MYKITFRLTAPVIFIDRPMFDGIVAWCWQQEHYPDQFGRLHISEKELINFDDMPIALHPDGYFLASWMFFEGAAEEMRYKRKKWDDQNDSIAGFGRRKRKVDVQRGAFKSYELPRVAQRFSSPHPELSASPFGHVWFYFEGNMKGVQKLIDQHLIGIGKDVNQGGGHFSEYVFEKLDQPFNPRQMRPVPIDPKDLPPGKRAKFMPYKPPYWDPQNAQLCLLPEDID